MALALPTANALAEVMPQSASMRPSAELDCRIIVSSEPRSLARHRDAFICNESPSILSPEESDDETPLSPITFRPNEVYERSRLSYLPPIPRPSSTPSSPKSVQSLSPVSPVIFSQQNLSSPTLAWTPPPVFPSAGTQSLALRLKRPLPPLPQVDTDDTLSPATESRSRQERTSANSWARWSPSSSNDRDSDIGFSPAASSQSPATSVYTSSPSDDSIGSSKAVETLSAGEFKPKVSPLVIPVRSQSNPLPPIGKHISSPYISVTPASPVPHQQFPFMASSVRERKRTASATSLVIASPMEGINQVFQRDDEQRQHQSQQQLSPERTSGFVEHSHPLSRSSSPAPSLSPSIASSTRSFAHPGKVLRRIASKTRLFGRRTLSASEPTWDDDSEETVIGHELGMGSHSFDDKLLRPGEGARADSPSTLTLSSNGSFERLSMDEQKPLRRVEIVEATLTPHGDIWKILELHDVIPKLRQLRA